MAILTLQFEMLLSRLLGLVASVEGGYTLDEAHERRWLMVDMAESWTTVFP